MKSDRTQFYAPSVLVILALGTVFLAAAPQGKKPEATPDQSKAKSPTSVLNRSDEAARLNNLGTAYMNQQSFEKAARLFQQAYALDPRLAQAHLNEGIALLNLQKTDDAKRNLEEVIKQEPENARAWYNLGLLYKGVADNDAALDAFQHAVEYAPNDANAYYFLGLMYSQKQQPKEAIAAFQHALRIEPYHASAEFGLARAYQKDGQATEAKAHLTRFQQITQQKLGVPLTLAYGDQGQLSLAQPVATKIEDAGPPIPVKFVVAQGTGLSRSTPPPLPDGIEALLGRGACFIDYDLDGLPDLFLTAGGKQGGMALYHNLGKGRFEEVTTAAGLDPKRPAIACAVSDYDNDTFPDLAISFGDSIALYHNEHQGKFKDVTEAAGLSKAKAGALAFAGLLWVDFDHDGDTDLLVTNRQQGATDAEGNKPHNFLFRNNGNGAFTDFTEESGLGRPDAATFGGALSDFNNDRAVDFILSGRATQILLNPREGKFLPLEKMPEIPGPTLGIAVLDFNKDTWMDLAFTHDKAPGLTLWRNLDGRTLEPVPLPPTNWVRAWGVTALDYDNDGYLDLAAVGETADGKFEARLFRNLGRAGFKDVTADVGLDKIQLKDPRAIMGVDYDGDGDTDLLITQNSGPALLLRNDGGNANHALRIALKGLNDNRSGIGTKVEVFAGTLSQKWELSGAGYLGQGAVDILAGLGKQQQADVVRLLWPTGVVQDEIEISAAKPARILEIDRRGSSCPVLFAWDGTRYRFIGDMIGAGVIGHWVGPGERNVPDPTEYLKVDGATVKARDGRLSFRFMEPMEEAVYLDQVRLLAIDHPQDVTVNPNEYFASNPPYPEFKVISSRKADLSLPAGAWDDKGRDVLAKVARIDHDYVSGFRLLSFAGFAEPHYLELDLGQRYGGGSLRLLLHGFIEYFTATGMFAAHQAGIDPVAPYVEAQDSNGKWLRVVDDMGFPAGLPRTTVADLSGKLPLGTRRIRIGTNLQIYWDQILIDRTTQAPEFRLSKVPLAKADLGFHGYPRDIERPANAKGDHYYVYEDVSLSGPYVRQPGAYTRPGNVLDLLERVDDRFVIFGSGDEVRLDFDPAKLPPLPAGWTRDYFFFADGFEKDMDFYAAEGLTVAPLPFHEMGTYPYPAAKNYPLDVEHLNYLLDFNTRFYSETPTQEFRFRFAPARKARAPQRLEGPAGPGQ
ncbi:MAG TPA: FG-GAP-like repeat-containing protein [Terriglobales bacterium]|nr:FG-GAP-like repeat-containing protein [Terriglobales bacterium]